MILKRNVQQRYVRRLYDALEDLRHKVQDHCRAHERKPVCAKNRRDRKGI